MALAKFWFPGQQKCDQVSVRTKSRQGHAHGVFEAEITPLGEGVYKGDSVLLYKTIALLLITIASGSAWAGLRCPKGSTPVTRGGFRIRGESYRGLKEITLSNKEKLTLCFKVRKRTDYLMVPYDFEPSSNLRPVFSGDVDLRDFPIVKSLKGYFEKEVVLINLSAARADEKLCQSYPPACAKDLIVNVYWRAERGPTPIETICPDGFLPQYYNPITLLYSPGIWGYRQVGLRPKEPRVFCYFLTAKINRLRMTIADRTGTAQCGYHDAIFSPPPNDKTNPIYTGRTYIGSGASFWNSDGSSLPRGIWTIEVTATGQIPTCNNKMEITVQ